MIFPSAAKWNRHGFNVCPSALDSTPDKVFVAAELSAPLRIAARYFVMSYELITSCVSRLLFFSGPFAITRRIPSVIVNSLNGHAVRTFSHIREEPLECNPRIAYRDTPAAIVLISDGIRVCASLYHSIPYLIRACSSHSMFCNIVPYGLIMKAPAGFGVSAVKVASIDDSAVSTDAVAVPVILSSSVLPLRESSKAYSGYISKFLSCYVSKIKVIRHVAWDNINLRHFMTSLRSEVFRGWQLTLPVPAII